MKTLNMQEVEQVNGGVPPVIIGIGYGVAKAVKWGSAAFAGGYLAQRGSNLANEHDGR